MSVQKRLDLTRQTAQNDPECTLDPPGGPRDR